MKTKKKYKTNNQGDCPLCGSELEYYDTDYDGDSVSYKWNCTNKKCDAVGKEYFTIKFDSHGQVQDKDGNDILNSNGY